MTDNETRPQCRAMLLMRHRAMFRCILTENHAGRHLDGDGDTWDIEYADVDPPQRFVPVPGLGSVEISDLSSRVTEVEKLFRALRQDNSRIRSRLTELETLGARVDNLEQTSASGAAADDMFAAMGKRVSALEAALTPAQPPENEAVLIDPVELGKLLEASELLSTLETSVQDPGTCSWASPTGAFCNLPEGHTVDHITPYPPDHVCGPSCD